MQSTGEVIGIAEDPAGRDGQGAHGRVARAAAAGRRRGAVRAAVDRRSRQVGLIPLAKALRRAGYRLAATPGTRTALREAGFGVEPIAKLGAAPGRGDRRAADPRGDRRRRRPARRQHPDAALRRRARRGRHPARGDRRGRPVPHGDRDGDRGRRGARSGDRGPDRARPADHRVGALERGARASPDGCCPPPVG
jgi:hypothetical protein